MARVSERDLDALLAGLTPLRRGGEFVFVSVAAAPAGVSPVVTVAEDEGLTLVLRREEADALGLGYEFVAAMITMQVNSDLAAVGLTAAISTALGKTGIACNVVAGFHHDHLFVPVAEADRAIAVLRGLSGARRAAD